MSRWLIREATPRDAVRIARVHVDVSRATYRERLPAGTLAAMTCEMRARLWAETLGGGDEFVFVAEDEPGEIIGFASGKARV